MLKEPSFLLLFDGMFVNSYAKHCFFQDKWANSVRKKLDKYLKAQTETTTNTPRLSEMFRVMKVCMISDSLFVVIVAAKILDKELQDRLVK